MNERITDLVDVIMREMQEHPDGSRSEKALRSWLVRQGYKKREIDAAMALVAPRVAGAKSSITHQPGSMRAYSLHEEYKLTLEARDALTRLELYGLITPSDRELILEHLGHFDSEVGLDELDYLLSWLVCGGRDVEFQQTLANVLDGRGDAVH